MNSTKPSNRRMTSRQSVIAFVGGNVMPDPGRVVPIDGLYSMYRNQVSRFRKPVSKDRFLKILNCSGYRTLGVYHAILLDHLKV